MKNLLSYCGLFDAKIKASDKDLPELLDFEASPFALKSESELSILNIIIYLSNTNFKRDLYIYMINNVYNGVIVFLTL